MISTASGPDIYFAYKFHHVRRAELAWTLSEEFGVYEALRDGPATVSEVGERTGLQERPSAILLAANACIGIVGVDGDRYYIYDVIKDMVLEGGRARVTPRPPDPEDSYYRMMKQALQTNQMVPEGMPTWLTNPTGEGEEPPTAYAPGRHGWRMLWGEALANAFDFTPYRKVADMGSAGGGLLTGLMLRCPHLEGVLVDLPYSTKTAEAFIEADGLTDRLTFHAADFFTDPLPDDVDVFFMSHVLHDWDDDHCIRLLRRCYELLPVGSPVIAQEFTLSEDKSECIIGVFQWFGLVHGTIGDQRTAREIGALMDKAGFERFESREVDHEQMIVVGWKEQRQK